MFRITVILFQHSIIYYAYHLLRQWQAN